MNQEYEKIIEEVRIKYELESREQALEFVLLKYYIYPIEFIDYALGELK